MNIHNFPRLFQARIIGLDSAYCKKSSTNPCDDLDLGWTTQHNNVKPILATFV